MVTDEEVEAACETYLLSWDRMGELAKLERRQRMRLALEAAARVRVPLPAGRENRQGAARAQG